MSFQNEKLLAGLRRESCTTDRAALRCLDILATLEKSREHLQLLADAGELIEGGCAEDALDRLEDAINMLEPDEPSLRVVGGRKTP